MNQEWWFDSLLLTVLTLLLVAIYKLSRRTFSIHQDQSQEQVDYVLPGISNKLFPYNTIRHAGYNPEKLYALYWIVKLFSMALSPLIAIEILGPDINGWILLGISIAGFLFLDIGFWMKSRKRKIKVQQSVSYFSDLLVVFLKSGLSLPQAFGRASQFGLPPSNPLSKELKLISSEMEIGRSWQESFNKLAVRTGVKDLKRLALIMKIGYETGIPVIESLSTQADLLREKKKERVNEILSRKSLEALLPTALLSLPMFLVLVFFPTGVQIYEAFQLFTTSW